MGRSGEEEKDGGRRLVKRQVVSVRGPSVEVVSEEKFARRLQGMSGCVGCHKERSSAKGHSRGKAPRSQRYNNNNNNNNSGGSGISSYNKNSGKQSRRGKAGKRMGSKSSTPIVIHIKDTLRSAVQHKERGSVDTDSDVSVKSIDEDIFGDVSSIPEFKPQQQQHVYPVSDSPPLTFPQPLVSRIRRHSEKSKKNLTALISVIEKAHHKESCHIQSNLACPSSGDSSSKLCQLLNNEVCAHEKSFSLQRSIVDCENVDVICNDLHKHGKGGPGDDTDSVSDKSSVSSSSEAVSDPDALLVEEGSGFEFSPEELQRLAEYTTGYPIYRYDCAPSECPQCLSMWYYHQACMYEGCHMDTSSHPHTSAWDKGDCHHDTDHDTTLDASEEEADVTESEDMPDISWGAPANRSRTPSVSSSQDLGLDYVSWESTRNRSYSTSSVHSVECVEPTPSTSPSSSSSFTVQARSSWTSPKSRQLWDIDISHGARPWEQGVQQSNPFPNSVYLDLTGTDVSISVYYHHSLLQDEGARAALHTLSRASSSFQSPPAAPLFSLCYQASPVCGLSLPVSFFTEHSDLPQIAMVPPHELKAYVGSAPPPREWMMSAKYEPDESTPSAMVQVMCYNMLCNSYCTKRQYAYCPSWALQWEYRKKLLWHQLETSGCDIFCLQEMETESYDFYFKPMFANIGFEGVFVPKTRALSMHVHEERIKVDGCSIFYNRKKFELLEVKKVEFGLMARAYGKDHEQMLNRVMSRDNVGMIILLKTKPGILAEGKNRAEAKELAPNLLVVATAHMHWDPEHSDVKLVQTMMLMSELDEFMYNARHRHWKLISAVPENRGNIPLILTGDYNSLPDSGVTEFLTQGKVAKNHPDFKNLNYLGVLEKLCRADKTHLHHTFDLQQACKDIMPFTNYTYEFKGTIDYILHSQQLRLVMELMPYDSAWLKESKTLGCPNAHIPSDHFPLAAVFEIPLAYLGRNSNRTNDDHHNR